MGSGTIDGEGRIGQIDAGCTQAAAFESGTVQSKRFGGGDSGITRNLSVCIERALNVDLATCEVGLDNTVGNIERAAVRDGDLRLRIVAQELGIGEVHDCVLIINERIVRERDPIGDCLSTGGGRRIVTDQVQSAFVGNFFVGSESNGGIRISGNIGSIRVGSRNRKDSSGDIHDAAGASDDGIVAVGVFTGKDCGIRLITDSIAEGSNRRISDFILGFTKSEFLSHSCGGITICVNEIRIDSSHK